MLHHRYSVMGTTGNTLTYSGALTALHQRTQTEANQLIRAEWKVEKNGNTLKLYLEQPRYQRVGLNVSWRSPHLKLNIPNTETIKITTSNGSVNIRSINGNCVVQTSNAPISMFDIKGTANLKTSNGSITLKSIEGSVIADDSNGSIRASSIHGTTNLHTSNAAVNLDNMVGPVTAYNNNGAIMAASNIDGNWDLETSNARIALSVPSRTNAKTHASTSHGSINGNVHWISSPSGQHVCILGRGLRRVALNTSNGSISKYYPHAFAQAKQLTRPKNYDKIQKQTGQHQEMREDPPPGGSLEG